MSLLVLRNLTHSFGGPSVLHGASLRVDAGDRVCVFGRNGEGKSTLLRVIAGQQDTDEGSVDVTKGATVALLTQDVPEPEGVTIFEAVTESLGEARDILKAYHDATAAVAENPSDATMVRLEQAQRALEAADGWAVQQRVESALSRLGLDPETSFASLSGGWRRRVALARVLALQPDVLLLDEPTNHLDIEAIEWLENLLIGTSGAIMFVSHDRTFVRNVATRIVELDRGALVEYPANFDEYLEAKAKALEIEERHDAEFDKKLAQEEAWIRTGIKARRTRNEGRVRALKAMRSERRARRDRKGKARIVLHDAERSGELVAEASHLSFAYDGGPSLIRDLSIRVRRGDRWGLIGPNGVGKTTLLKLLLGELEPSAGHVRTGTRLKIRYYDQLRAQLDDNLTLKKAIAPDDDRVVVNGEPRHVIAYLRGFLFDDDQVNAPVSVLSGGERNRLLLAKLFAEPANVLVLDEPTNDLDVETLQVLEEQLLAFQGAILLVSHDREFLDSVATQSLVFEGDGVITHVVGGYDEWSRLRDERAAAAAAPASKPDKEARTQTTPRKRLTYAQRLELEALPAQIEGMESEQAGLQDRLADPSVASDHMALAEITNKLAALQDELETLYDRWEALESANDDM